jgi:hypothetical protein
LDLRNTPEGLKLYEQEQGNRVKVPIIPSYPFYPINLLTCLHIIKES